MSRRKIGYRINLEVKYKYQFEAKINSWHFHDYYSLIYSRFYQKLLWKWFLLWNQNTEPNGTNFLIKNDQKLFSFEALCWPTRYPNLCLQSGIATIYLLGIICKQYFDDTYVSDEDLDKYLTPSLIQLKYKIYLQPIARGLFLRQPNCLQRTFTNGQNFKCPQSMSSLWFNCHLCRKLLSFGGCRLLVVLPA